MRLIHLSWQSEWEENELFAFSPTDCKERKISGNGPETPGLMAHQRNANDEFDAASRSLRQAEGATQQLRTFSHAAEPGSSLWRGTVCPEANTIIADLQDEPAMLASQPHIHL